MPDKPKLYEDHYCSNEILKRNFAAIFTEKHLAVLCCRERVKTLLVRRSQSHTSYAMEEAKEKIVEYKMRESRLSQKALELLLKPTSSTPSNTGSSTRFLKLRERGTMVLLH